MQALRQGSAFAAVVYCGDGANDLCPALALGPEVPCCSLLGPLLLLCSAVLCCAVLCCARWRMAFGMMD